MQNFFMVRAGEGGHLAEDFADKELVAIGWPAAGDLSSVTELSRFRALVAQAYPQMKKGAMINGAGILYKFRKVLQVGDRSFPTTRRNASTFLDRSRGTTSIGPTSSWITRTCAACSGWHA